MQVHGQAAREGLTLLSVAIQSAAHTALRMAIEVAEADAKRTTLWKDRTNKTRDSIKATIGPERGKVTARGASHFLEYGTRAHEIAARRVQFLRFMVNGQTVFRRRVHHPGTSKRPFMHEARERAEIVAAYETDFMIGYAIENVR